MLYARTVATAVGALLGLWIVWNAALILHQSLTLHREHATGFGFLLGGIVEGILTAIILGVLAGTVWYFVRRH